MPKQNAEMLKNSATLFFGFNRHQPARAVGEDTSLVSAG